jgi:hypothetical protein
VDNGPDGLTRKANDALYDLAGLRAAHRALRPTGVLAVWSAKPDENFTTRLGRANFAVDVLRVPARGARGGGKHVIWVATRDERAR